jgi:hypothetical protein
MPSLFRELSKVGIVNEGGQRVTDGNLLTHDRSPDSLDVIVAIFMHNSDQRFRKSLTRSVSTSVIQNSAALSLSAKNRSSSLPALKTINLMSSSALCDKSTLAK